MKKIFVWLMMFLAALNATATTYYISPSGSDSNSGTAQGAPWRTFNRAVPVLVGGDTLTLLNGFYTVGTTGVFSANCSSGAHSGSSGAHVTVTALNERQAFIQGDGATADSFRLENCNYWNIIGLHIESKDSSSGQSFIGEALHLISSSNNILRRNIVAHNNRYKNVHLITLESGSSNNLIEENEVYYFHRWGIVLFSGSNNNEVRRNYADQRGWTDINGGYPSGGVSFGIGAYTSDSNMFENNIAENIVGVGHNVENTGSNNTFLGNVSGKTLTYGFRIGPHSGQPEPTGNVFNQNVSVLPSSIGFWSRSGKATYDRDSAFGSAAPIAGFLSDTDSCCVFSSYQFVVNNSTAQNFLANYGYHVINTSGNTFGFTNDNNFGNAVAYSPSSNVSSPNASNPAFGACYLWVPDASPLKSLGIGATILYQYAAGSLTNVPLWSSTGVPNYAGAIVTGLNDVVPSLVNVGARLNINQNGCSFPSGYNGGSGGPPPPANTVSVFPTTLTVPSSYVGTPSSMADITFSNTTTVTISINSITPSTNFSDTTDCGATIVAGNSCTVHVTGTPPSAGAYTGTVVFSFQHSESPLTVNLTSTGLSPQAPAAPTGLAVRVQ